jgi:hypothetical protein
MRDKRFIAEHRGGLLRKKQHYLLMEWARSCAKHVTHLLGKAIDARLERALDVAMRWKKGNASVGDARKASIDAIRAARELSEPVAAAVTRSAGHAVATAHMADHSIGAAWYALRAVKNAGGSIDYERQWQDRHLPVSIRDLVTSVRKKKDR